jgi:leader peptidase (prepilin peptidase)/N-methyltransferase
MVFNETLVGLGLAGALLGLIFGSAINAMVWRLHNGKSWAKGRSVCTECGHVLAARDLIPVLSWLELRGKCRYCHKPFQDSPWVELTAMLVFAVSLVVLGVPETAAEGVRLVFWLVIAVMLLVLAVYDARWMILPNKVMLPLLMVAGAYTISLALLAGDWRVLVGPLEAAVLAGGGFWLLVWGSRGRAMGGGDIKLAAAMGLILGVQATMVAMLVAFNLGALVGLWLIATRRKSRRDHIPFGPFLVAGTFVAFWWGRDLVEWYFRINGL